MFSVTDECVLPLLVASSGPIVEVEFSIPWRNWQFCFLGNTVSVFAGKVIV